MTTLGALYEKALGGGAFSLAEAERLWLETPLDELMAVAHLVRERHVAGRCVTWQIDRNINITNACASACLFCGFHAGAGNLPLFTTTRESYRTKISELLALGGDQVLLQGGLDPRMGLDAYEELFRWLKSEFPTVKLHALGPPEVYYIASRAGLSIRATLERLVRAGLDSLPGAGAEILVDRVRQLISPRKASAAVWLEVMREAQRMGLLTSATMMYGHVETLTERLQHLLTLRDFQAEALSEGRRGFLAFIAWPFQGHGTRLAAQYPYQRVTGTEHLRLIAVARLVLHNIPHIQASWLTVGHEVAAQSLWGGADDMGSIMIEENVVASTGMRHRMDRAGMIALIRDAGFEPRQRNQAYELLPSTLDV